MRIFRINEEGLLVLDKEYIRGIPAFRRILERDRGSEGDAQGSKKFRAFKEFFFIYLYKDLYSYINMGGYNEKESFKIAVKDSQLEENFKIDSELKIAIEKYIEIQETLSVTLNVINTIIKGLKLSDTIAKGVIRNIENQLEAVEKIRKDKLDKGEPIDMVAELTSTEILIKQLDVIIDMANKLPKTIKGLEDLQEKLRKEESGSNVARGGQNIGTRANPNKNHNEYSRL